MPRPGTYTADGISWKTGTAIPVIGAPDRIEAVVNGVKVRVLVNRLEDLLGRNRIGSHFYMEIAGRYFDWLCDEPFEADDALLLRIAHSAQSAWEQGQAVTARKSAAEQAKEEAKYAQSRDKADRAFDEAIAQMKRGK
jgi:hypothetical protein